jgi:hypothetical protein
VLDARGDKNCDPSPFDCAQDDYAQDRLFFLGALGRSVYLKDKTTKYNKKNVPNIYIYGKTIFYQFNGKCYYSNNLFGLITGSIKLLNAVP